MLVPLEIGGDNAGELRQIAETLFGENLGVRTGTAPRGARPFETLMKHPDYHQGMVMSVEAYDTEADALAGHAKWAEKIRTNDLPDVIVDCLNDSLSQFVMTISGGKAKEMFEFTRYAPATPTELVALKRLEAMNNRPNVDGEAVGDTCQCAACLLRREIFGAEPGEDARKGMRSEEVQASARVIH